MSETLSVEISANTVAWYGAALSTIIFLVGIYKLWIDRAHVKVRMQSDMIIAGEDPNLKRLLISVVNRGRRPVTITHIGLKFYGGKSLVTRESVRDRELTEGRETKVLIPQEGIDLNQVEHVFALDAVGRSHKAYLSRFPTFRKLFRRFRSSAGNRQPVSGG